MSYETNHSSAPSNNTGDLTSSLIRRVEHNPYHHLATTIHYPDGYDEFVTQTNDQMSPVLVEDETYGVSAILTGELYNNSLYLQHKPKFRTPITVSDGVITNGTDYEHGVVYFSTMPTGEFTVQYLSDPDKYFGEHITVLQASIHKLENLLGAGTTVHEGIKNAEFILASKPAALNNRLPHAVSLSTLTGDLSFGSEVGTDPIEITLGSGQDTVNVDAVEFNVYSSTGDTTINLGQLTGDLTNVAGDLTILGHTYAGDPSTTVSPSVSQVTVDNFKLTGTPYTGDTLKLAVHGDAVFFGDAYFFGQVISIDVTREITVSVHESDLAVDHTLTVGGDSYFGTSTNSRAYFAGNATLTGGLTVIGAGNASISFDGPIVMTNGSVKGPFQQGTVDGLDCSYIERVRKYQRPEFKTGHVNDGVRAVIYSGTVTSTGAANELIDTGASTMASALPAGTFFSGRFNGGDFVALITSGPNAGQRVPIWSYNNTAPYKWFLSRSLATAATAGTTYQIYHANGHSNVVQAATGLNVTIKGSTSVPLIANANGIIKVRTTDYTLSLPASTTSYVFLSTAPGVNGIDQDEPTFYSKTNYIEDEKSVLLAAVTTDGSSVTAITNYDFNASYDSGWVKFDTVASGNVKLAGADWTIDAKIGSNVKQINAKFSGLIYNGSSPSINGARLPLDSTIYIKQVSADSIVVKTTGSTYLGYTVPYWLRIIVA